MNILKNIGLKTKSTIEISLILLIVSALSGVFLEATIAIGLLLAARSTLSGLKVFNTENIDQLANTMSAPYFR